MPPSLRWSQVARECSTNSSATRLGACAVTIARMSSVERAAGVALEDLDPERGDVVGLAMDRHVGLEHHAAQDLVVDAGLDLQRGARVASRLRTFWDFA